jgi:hypothetical protein
MLHCRCWLPPESNVHAAADAQLLPLLQTRLLLLTFCCCRCCCCQLLVHKSRQLGLCTQTRTWMARDLAAGLLLLQSM